MDSKSAQENGLKTSSFRNKDYNNRRVFLRSYPLHWGGEDEKTDEEMVRVTNENIKKKPIKKIILSVFHWGEGKVLVLRRFKDKLQVYVIACVPVSFKPPAALISV